MLDIKNFTKNSVDKKILTAVAKKVLLGENKGTQKLSLAFVGKEEIKKLNKKFRGKNKATDVLSFSAQGGPAWGGESEKNYLGEVVICPEVVKEKKEKLPEVFIHGILHLCGYDHGKSKKEAEIMEVKEKFYLENR